MKYWLAFATALCAQSIVCAQTERKLAYEVVSIKPHPPENRLMMADFGQNSGGRLNVSGLPVSMLIRQAYTSGDGLGGPLGLSGPIAGLPGWASTDRFDIEARPEPGFIPTREQSREMLRTLLEERFHLKAHMETKDGPVYALVVAKNGPKMKLSPDQTPLPLPGERPPSGAAPPPPPPPPAPGFNPRTAALSSMPRGVTLTGPGILRGTAMTMARLATPLSGQAGRPVVDRTGLKELYDIELSFASTQTMSPPPLGALPPGVNLPEPDPNLPSIFTAVQEQLGLKLEPATAPLESVVVEHIEKPTEN